MGRGDGTGSRRLMTLAVLTVVAAACSSDPGTAEPRSAGTGSPSTPAETSTSAAPAPPETAPDEAEHDHGGGGEIPSEPASFTIDPPSVFVTGLIDASTASTVSALVADHPDVDTVVFAEAGGDPSHGIDTGLALRAGGLHTHIVPGAVLEGAAVDVFLAGTRRTMSAEVELRVGSWRTPDGRDAADIPRDDPAHDRPLAYYDDMGIDRDFYWFRLQAAPAGEFHTMTGEEIERFGLLVLEP